MSGRLEKPEVQAVGDGAAGVAADARRDDRRKERRSGLSIEAKLREIGGSGRAGLDVPVVIVNLGPDGAFLRTSQTFPVGARVAMTFRLESFPLPIELEGEVRWVRSADDPGIGLQFLRISAYEKAAIGDYLNAINERVRNEIGDPAG